VRRKNPIAVVRNAMVRMMCCSLDHVTNFALLSHLRSNSVLRERFKNMEEIHRKHTIQLDDGLSQDDGDGSFTQGTTVSRMSFGTTFTTATTNTHAITREDMDAFQRALDAKCSDLTYEFESAKKKHRSEEDEIQREIAELQAKKAAIDNGEILLVN
jgi:hypothetical protein